MSSGPKVADKGNTIKKRYLNSGLDVFLTLKELYKHYQQPLPVIIN